ncbi:MAG: hypothetical protein IJ251_00155, partial [Oscillospiraceae bacterium]|nr:hypothetical protein [Oscillospiraceae bacterium]
MENTRITSKDIRSDNNFDLNTTAKHFSSNDFWYYTSAATASLILSNKCFHVSCFNEMNDLNEIRLHEEEKDKIHALCFVNSKSEKIPMWYL